MKPSHTGAKDRAPLKVARLEPGGRLVAAVVKHNRRSNAHPTITVDCRHIGAGHSIVGKTFIERFHSHCLDSLGNQVTDGIVHHRRRNAGLKLKAVCQVCSHVEFAATHMNLTLYGLAKWDDSRI